MSTTFTEKIYNTINYMDLLEILAEIRQIPSMQEKAILISPERFFVLKLLSVQSYNLNDLYTAISQMIQIERIDLIDLLENLEKENMIMYKSEYAKILDSGKLWINSFGKYEETSNLRFQDLCVSVQNYLEQTTQFHSIKNNQINEDHVSMWLLQFILMNQHSNIIKKNFISNIADKKNIMAKFYEWSETNDPASFVYITELAISDTLVELWELPKVSIGSFHNTRFYIDTPLLLDISGSNGSEAKELADKILSFIRNKTGKLWVFDRTMNELNKFINNANFLYKSSMYDVNKANKLTQFFYNNKTKFNDTSKIKLWEKQFKEKLFNVYKIEIDSQEYTENQYNDYAIGSEELEKRLVERRDNKEIDIADSINADVKNIDSIYKIRKDDGRKNFNSWENVPAVFLTRNTYFIEVCRELKHSSKNHKIPAIYLEKTLLYFIANGNKNEIKENMRLQLQSYAYALLSQSAPYMFGKIKNQFHESGTTTNKEQEQVFEVLVEEKEDIKEKLFAMEAVNETPHLFKNPVTDAIQIHEFVASLLTAFQDNQKLQNDIKQSGEKITQAENLVKTISGRKKEYLENKEELQNDLNKIVLLSKKDVCCEYGKLLVFGLIGIIVTIVIVIGLFIPLLSFLKNNYIGIYNVTLNISFLRIFSNYLYLVDHIWAGILAVAVACGGLWVIPRWTLKNVKNIWDILKDNGKVKKSKQIIEKDIENLYIQLTTLEQIEEETPPK